MLQFHLLFLTRLRLDIASKEAILTIGVDATGLAIYMLIAKALLLNG